MKQLHIYLLAAVTALCSLAQCSSEQSASPDGEMQEQIETDRDSLREGEKRSVPVNENRKLFVIGGGSRPDSLITALLSLAEVTAGDTILFLPWSSSEPDTSFYYASRQFKTLSEASLRMLRPEGWDEKRWNRQTLHNARLIYLPGGDQSRFMSAIEGSGIAEALYSAMNAGVVFAGTSAGAALMSEVMITGDRESQEEYAPRYGQLVANDAIYAAGLGFLTEAVIDQHFVARSRYDRLFTALADHHGTLGIGIDESTAIWVEGDMAEVRGGSQVLVFYPPRTFAPSDSLIHSRGIHVDILTAGDRFSLSDK